MVMEQFYERFAYCTIFVGLMKLFTLAQKEDKCIDNITEVWLTPR